MEVSWDGPDPEDRSVCPYAVDFQCKPAPAETLNSLESGRLLLEVGLGSRVQSVAVTLVNNAKQERLGDDRLEDRLEQKTSLSVALAQDSRRSDRWAGELDIPSSWMEGGTRTYERTGAASPKSEKNLYTLEITYTLDSGNSCTARFGSEDAFHWQARQKATM